MSFGASVFSRDSAGDRSALRPAHGGAPARLGKELDGYRAHRGDRATFDSNAQAALFVDAGGDSRHGFDTHAATQKDVVRAELVEQGGSVAPQQEVGAPFETEEHVGEQLL